MITIDQMIEVLQKAKKDLGGNEELLLHINCNGLGDFISINELSYSGLFGLHIDINPPWWYYKSAKKYNKDRK
jgi:hypothetical protein